MVRRRREDQLSELSERKSWRERLPMNAITDHPGSSTTLGVRGEILHFTGDPMTDGSSAVHHHADGILLVRDGRIAGCGDAIQLLPALAPDVEVVDYRGKVIMPGFVDTHIHYSQTDIIASYGEQLLDWLERFTFPAERLFASREHAAEVAGFFLGELLKNGTTTASVFTTVHPESTDAFFEAAARRNLRMAAGKVLMDRNCPEFLRDTAESGYEQSAELIQRWHGRGRLSYSVTPRFAPTSTDRQLQLAGRLLDEHPGVLLQSHVAENQGEVAWVAELFPWARSYLDVYDRYGMLRRGAVFAHCIYLDDDDRRRMAATGASMSFCATSNLFLGSGLFDLFQARAAGVTVGIGTDVGGGTAFSLLRTLNESYKVTQLKGHQLPALQGFYLITLGGARALGLDGHIGSFEPGKEADFVVLDPESSALRARRNRLSASFEERLFMLMMLGDDRAVHATYVMGECAYAAAEQPTSQPNLR
jgi:guanine deaminase